MTTVEARDELIGVPRATAARIAGVPEERLRRWARAGLISPMVTRALGGSPIWTFGLEDLVQASVVRELEDRGVHIRTVRTVVEAARSATDPRPLASLRWATDAGYVYVGYPDGSWVGGRVPNQAVLVEVINLDEIRSRARDAIRRSPADGGSTERRRGAVGYKEVFTGTRVPVATVVDYLVAGADDRRIRAAFPELTEGDIAVARARLAQAG